MRCVGIVAEYNPFHKGHSYHIQAAKEAAQAEFAVVVMSGDFVQRGEVAMFDKYMRAKHALENGADIILMMNAAHSLSSAERFARAGIDMLAGSGIVDAVAFGSESNDMYELSRAADMVISEKIKPELDAALAQGCSYPAALSIALGKDHGPNDVLAIEYLRALKAYPSIEPFTIKRTTPHDGGASALAVREAVLDGNMQLVESLLPENVLKDIKKALEERLVPRVNERLISMLLYRLRTCETWQLQRFNDVNEGLENVILRSARAASSYDELIRSIKSKRYTMSRIKRILMCVLTDITSSIQMLAPQYIRVLGVRGNSIRLLSELGHNATLPVITKYSDLCKLDEAGMLLHDADMRAASVAALAAPEIYSDRFEYASKLLIV